MDNCTRSYNLFLKILNQILLFFLLYIGSKIKLSKIKVQFKINLINHKGLPKIKLTAIFSKNFKVNFFFFNDKKEYKTI